MAVESTEHVLIFIDAEKGDTILLFSITLKPGIHRFLINLFRFLDRCYDAAGKETCEWRVRNGHKCQAYYMEIDCAATCGYCGKRT